MKRFFLFLLLPTILFKISVAQDIRLSLNLPVGYSFITETTQTFIVEQEFMGIQYNTQMETGSTIHFQVKSINKDSSYNLDCSYQKMNIRVSSMLINMEVNSETTFSGDSLSAALMLLKNKVFRIKMNTKGVIEDIYGLDELITEIAKASKLPEEQAFEFNRNLIQSLGKEALLDNYKSNSAFYPELSHKLNDKWSFEIDMIKNGIPMKLSSQIRLKELSKSTAIYVSEGRLNSQNPSTEKPQSDQSFYLVGNEFSEVKINSKNGLIRESIISQNITGTIKTPPTDSTSRETFIPFKVVSRNTMITNTLK